MDGATCSVVDNYICLTENQTATLLASELDPGTTGFLIAVATNSLGCPVSFNALMGDEYVRFSGGHETNLAAEAALALNLPPMCDENSFAAQLNFNGINYGLLGRALALSNLADRASGNDTMLILNRIGGNLATASAQLGSIFGIVFNDQETPFSFTLAPNTCQLINTLSNNFPRTAPRLEQIIPSGRSGWMRLWTFDDMAIFGAAINANRAGDQAESAFPHGHNLHKLTVTAVETLTIPVFPPNCD